MFSCGVFTGDDGINSSCKICLQQAEFQMKSTNIQDLTKSGMILNQERNPINASMEGYTRTEIKCKRTVRRINGW